MPTWLWMLLPILTIISGICFERWYWRPHRLLDLPPSVDLITKELTFFLGTPRGAWITWDKPKGVYKWIDKSHGILEYNDVKPALAGQEIWERKRGVIVRYLVLRTFRTHNKYQYRSLVQTLALMDDKTYQKYLEDESICL